MGLRQNDLENLVDNIFEIDAYKSKMGDDKNIITLSFVVKDKSPADDLASFLESGFPFVLDSDVTAGEQSDGNYKVFVEIERSSEANDQILEIASGVSKLANMDNLKFRYYKNWRSEDLTLENLSARVPLDPENYGIVVNETNLENYKNFFNKSYVEEISMNENILTIKKSWADPINFRFIDFGNKNNILNKIEESLNVNDFSEIIFLSKYIGDYNITKYGRKLTFENDGKTVVLERLQ